MVAQGFSDPKPTDLEVTCATEPMRVDPTALALGDHRTWTLDPDRCIGCGVCATGCGFEALSLVERAGVPPPPPDQRALLEAVKAGQT